LGHIQGIFRKVLTLCGNAGAIKITLAEKPMHKMSPVDELAEIRADIARLKLREAALRQVVLSGDAATGRWYRAEVMESRARVFDARLLPPQIRDNPAYWRERLTKMVKCLPVQARAERPGWPIRRGEMQGAHLQ
jgi:hypothetical protein